MVMVVVVMVCVCNQFIYPAICRPVWVMAAAVPPGFIPNTTKPHSRMAVMVAGGDCGGGGGCGEVVMVVGGDGGGGCGEVVVVMSREVKGSKVQGIYEQVDEN